MSTPSAPWHLAEPSAPSISLPKGGGALRGVDEKFAANPMTGSGALTVPLRLSSARAGSTPRLELSYDSGNGSGPFGLGWTLALPAVTRKTDSGLPRYVDAVESDVFLLSGAEDLVPVYRQDAAGGWVRDAEGDYIVHEDEVEGHRVRRYRPRVEGLFARVERWTRIGAPEDVHWRSITRDDVLTVYGATSESRIADPTDPGRIFSWLVCETRDGVGNAVSYRWKAEDGAGVDLGRAHERNRGRPDDARRTAARYLKHVRYGNRTPLLVDGVRPAFVSAGVDPDWMFEVVLDYGEHDDAAPTPADAGVWDRRPDPFSVYRAGFEVRTTRRCRRILMFHHFPADAEVGRDCLVRSTELSYDDGPAPAERLAARYSFLTSISETGYRRDGVGYLSRSLPPLEFEYTRAVLRDELREVDEEGAENLPVGVDGQTVRWADLHGEGVPGALTRRAGAWLYKRNLSPLTVGEPEVRARFGPLETVRLAPAAPAGAQLVDLAGDGTPDLVVMDGPAAGSFEHDDGEGWGPFRPFTSRLRLDLADPRVRLLDVDGDGRSDVLLQEDAGIAWHPSLGEEGFGPARRVAVPPDEELGPRVIARSGTESVHLADMSGDGLTDIVRVRIGEVCYWPNLGHGRFGAKVTMDGSPWFDHPGQFDPSRVQLADVDGTGAADLLYVHRRGVRLYLNECGNAWTAPQEPASLAGIDHAGQVEATDLLGNGTVCLVISSSLPGDARRPMRYLNLVGEHKPHLLRRVTNNLGTETRVDYAPSTTFYLRDRRDGRPWTRRLPFPVHVVERVEILDHVSRSRLVTRYAYHDGYFDGPEREFRGFGLVEQWDTETFAALAAGAAAANIDAGTYVPPVRTRTWFHLGVTSGCDGGFFREPGLSDAEARALRPPEPPLPPGLTPAEEREALRALKGRMLRQEVYADDAARGDGAAARARAATPYTVTESSHGVRLLQPRGTGRHAVVLPHDVESVTYRYERDATDPRVEHRLVLEVDDVGTVLKQGDVAYGRRETVRAPDGRGGVREVANPGLAALAAADRATQRATFATYTEHRVTNAIGTAGTHRGPMPCETAVFELTGYPTTGPGGLYRAEDLVEPDPGVPGRLRHRFTTQVGYEEQGAGPYCRRPIELIRTIYRRDDLTALLPLGGLQSRGLPGETYRLAFTTGLLDRVFRRPRPGQQDENLLPDAAAVLGGTQGTRGGYVAGAELAADGRFPAAGLDGTWWMPSGRVWYTPDPAPAAAELAAACDHFFVPLRYTDAFGSATRVRLDDHDLLEVETADALGNRVTAVENDYRVLRPRVVADANRNRRSVAFDALGLVAGGAVAGKPAPAPAEGDSLAGFVADLPQAQLDALFDAPDPVPQATALIGSAGTRTVHDLDRFRRTRDAHPDDPSAWQPACVVSIARETHVVAPAPPQGPRIQLRFGYSDGFGREVQQKVRAPGGRWIRSGWVVHDNKGQPVRTFEPSFSPTQRFDFAAAAGVAATLFRDPVGRVVATLHPNDTYDKTVHGAWSTSMHDVNDTCAPRGAGTGDPRTDPDVRGYVAGFFADRPEWRTWYEQRAGGALGAEERLAAERAEAHADTPTTVHLDPLGRPFATVSRNRVVCPGHDLDGTEETTVGRVVLDVEGNEREARDPLGRVAARYAHDMLGHRIHVLSMDAGPRWALDDVGGRPIRVWDARGHVVTTAYDALRRPVTQTVRGTIATGPAASDPRTLGRDVVVDRIEYGEPPPGATQQEVALAERLNLRTRVLRHFDGAGLATNARLDTAGWPVEAYDFKGNLLRGTRRLLADPTALADWGQSPALTAERFETATRYDALNRPVQSVAPRSDTGSGGRNVVQVRHDEAGRLARVDVWLERATEPAGLIDPATEAPSRVGITELRYDAKGQRLRVSYPNGVTTEYSYDPQTFRLTGLVTRRDRTAFPDDERNPPPTGWPGSAVQNRHHTYDPAGNLVHVRDDAQQRVFFRNRRIDPTADCTYDALYRLVQSTGREHLGQQGGVRRPPTAPDPLGGFPGTLDHPQQGDALGRYVERYVYDPVGNILKIQHHGTDPAHAGWTRAHDHLEPSRTEPGGPVGNRLSQVRVDPNGARPPRAEPYAYDAAGSVVRLPHLGGGAAGPNLVWDHAGRLARADLGGGGTVQYAYDAAGHRVHVMRRKQPGLVEERISLGGFEIFRWHGATIGPNPTRERQTLHVMDGTVRIALVEVRTRGTDPGPRRLIRNQVTDHLGSASLELDDRGDIISYEEYSPYGTTTYRAVRKRTETPKRYRYTGFERDEETGLQLHGARYYACWLGRWLSPDPTGLTDGPNLYQYAHDSPVTKVDLTGAFAGSPSLLAQLAAPTPTLAVPGGAGVAESAGTMTAAAGIEEAAGPLSTLGAAIITLAVLSTERYMRRTASLVQYGTPYGKPDNPQMEMAREQGREQERQRQMDNPNDIPAVLDPDAAPQPKAKPKEPQPKIKEKEDDRGPRMGRVYVTYFKFNTDTGLFYAGRTSMEVDLNRPIEEQALEAIANRDRNHHADETREPVGAGFTGAFLDRYAVGLAAEYDERYKDPAYLAIRGREQQLVDHFGLTALLGVSTAMSPQALQAPPGFGGGAWTDTDPGPHLTENDIRPVAKENPNGLRFHDMANMFFGPGPEFTGYRDRMLVP
ncbi:SpvB/TcaC N-terminal domain-containing protein [Streptomyces sp. NPDC056704]|uniref:SpvB/TcaC N-terminal domain-containing protein n=1 Tax=Streptomyces sp. NPDC056704 TaxID=3345917 RepID=UPI0036A10DE3